MYGVIHVMYYCNKCALSVVEYWIHIEVKDPIATVSEDAGKWSRTDNFRTWLLFFPHCYMIKFKKKNMVSF